MLVAVLLCKGGAGVRGVFSICVRRSSSEARIPGGCLATADRVFFQTYVAIVASRCFKTISCVASLFSSFCCLASVLGTRIEC
jgi:hypothetical protein